MKMVDIRSKKDEDLKSQLRDLKDEMFSLKFQHATGQLENTGRMSTVRRDIARVLTVIEERSRATQANESAEG